MFRVVDYDLIFWSDSFFKLWLLFILKTHLTKEWITNNKVNKNNNSMV